jgi:hypothetical protein
MARVFACIELPMWQKHPTGRSYNLYLQDRRVSGVAVYRRPICSSPAWAARRPRDFGLERLAQCTAGGSQPSMISHGTANTLSRAWQRKSKWQCKSSTYLLLVLVEMAQMPTFFFVNHLFNGNKCDNFAREICNVLLCTYRVA